MLTHLSQRGTQFYIESRKVVPEEFYKNLVKCTKTLKLVDKLDLTQDNLQVDETYIFDLDLPIEDKDQLKFI